MDAALSICFRFVFDKCNSLCNLLCHLLSVTLPVTRIAFASQANVDTPRAHQCDLSAMRLQIG